jgi:hypothetical protein
MEYDKKGNVDPLSTGVKVMQNLAENSGGELKIPQNFGYPNDMEPRNSLAINYGLDDTEKVNWLVKTYSSDPEFLKVAQALLGEEQVERIING